MMKRSLSLSQVDVASPCQENWDDMTGDDRCRACAVCRNVVYNISAMTEDEALRMIEEKIGEAGDLCIRLSRRADGTIMTQDCPIGMREKARKLTLRLAGGIAALIAALLLWPGSKAPEPELAGDSALDWEIGDPGPSDEPISNKVEENTRETMSYFGMICITRK